MTTHTILAKYNLSKTAGRIKILNVFLSNSVAFSESEIQDTLKNICDRATIYRTLKLFTQHNIIHPVSTDGMVTKYILKKEPEEHLHFKCSDCGKIKCLPEVEIKDYTLPDGYKKNEVNFLIIGICNECNV